MPVVLWTLFVPSAFAMMHNFNCDGVPLESLVPKAEVVKFDDFFAEFERMKPYYFSETSYLFNGSNVDCLNNDSPVGFVMNWNRNFAVLLRRWDDFDYKCEKINLEKDGKGLLGPKSDNPESLLKIVKFNLDSKALQLTYVTSSGHYRIHEFAPITWSSHNFENISNTNCSLDLGSFQKRKHFDRNRANHVISGVIVISLSIAAVVFFMCRWFQTGPVLSVQFVQIHDISA